METVTPQRASEGQANTAIHDDDFVNVDLGDYEKDVAVGGGVRKEPESKPIRFQKTKLVIILLSLIFLGTSSLIIALFVHLAKK